MIHLHYPSKRGQFWEHFKHLLLRKRSLLCTKCTRFEATRQLLFKSIKLEKININWMTTLQGIRQIWTWHISDGIPVESLSCTLCMQQHRPVSSIPHPEDKQRPSYLFVEHVGCICSFIKHVHHLNSKVVQAKIPNMGTSKQLHLNWNFPYY